VGDDARYGAADLLNELDRLGALPDPRWRAAFARIARDKYVPARVWMRDRGGFRVVDRAERPAMWWREVCQDHVVVTQVDEGRVAPESGAVGVEPTSSASQPSLVAHMLHLLEVADGMRVLDVGTGTGYTAALLSARLGAENVVGVEYDPALAREAQLTLRRDGWDVHVVTGDGNDGYPPGAPYDRIIVGCAFDRVPYAWIRQSKPGGVIVLPWATPGAPLGLLRLRTTRYGVATGQVVGDAYFMWDRTRRPAPPGELRQPGADAHESSTDLDPWACLADRSLLFAVAVQVPWCRAVDVRGGDPAVPYEVLLYDAEGSVATVSRVDRQGRRRVRQNGPRRLWDDVEAAVWRWIAAGSPARNRFGVTVTAWGQEVWLDDPAGMPWNPHG
jgi:protein-L-isoaspartate(D-aspartate) O-methyltransferase